MEKHIIINYQNVNDYEKDYIIVIIDNNIIKFKVPM